MGWQEALAWWRGAPFDDLDDWAPAVAERARLMELWNRAVEERYAATLATSDPATVAAEAERLVHAEPLRERRWALLMTALEAAGRRPEAIRTFDRARRTLATELGISPGDELTQLHTVMVSAGDAEQPETDRPARRMGGELPAPLTDIIGRSEEILLVADLLSTCRMVTVVGPGGIGKTRLALEVAHRVRGRFSAGAWSVELARISRPSAIEPLIVTMLSLGPTDSVTAGDALRRTIGNRSMLIVLDNAEHLLPELADVVARLLSGCARLRVLVTSREPLGVPGERVVRLTSLPVQGAGEELFCARARAVDASFVVDDLAALRAVSARLDGIPLAIELAAGRVRTVGLRELARRLDDRFDLLTATRRGDDERHRTMQATIAWSYDLLDPEQRELFAQVAVFRGRFELDAVEHIIDSLPAHQVARVLASLVDQSMVLADGVEPARFRLLEPLRHAAARSLDTSGHADTAAARHAAYFADLAASLDAQRRGPNEIEATTRLEAARDNFRGAFRYAVQTGDVDTALRIATPLAGYGGVHVWGEPSSWCAEALELPGSARHALRVHALIGMSDGAWQQGRHADAVELALAAVADSTAGGEVWRDAHRVMASALVWMGRFADAEAAATTSVNGQPDTVSYAALSRLCTRTLIRNLVGRPEPEIVAPLLGDAQALGNPTGLALALHTAGVIVGHTDRALNVDFQRRAARLAAATGAKLIEGFALIVLAAAESDIDPLRGARAQVDVMKHYLAVGNRAHLRSFARGLLQPLVLLARHEAAAIVDGATSSQPELGAGAERRQTWTERAERTLGPAFPASVERGAAMTDDELVAYLDETLNELDTRPGSGSKNV